MSKQVDERVVEMRFDNAQFEKNVATTMSTLDKLKQSLNLTGAAKGFEDVSAAAKKVDMNGLTSGVEKVGLKFNWMYTVADQALRNITNSAMAAGKRIVNSLTIDPVKTGFNEYELKMGSIQTIMASTGESLDTVNAYLEELNKYSDQTIYSFSDMTTNIGKFTNAGVKLEDAVLAIKGISNEAAVSGANANEASRAMYNFAQALSAGFVKLIDWKSIENANMATVEFKNQLLESAVAAGTLEKQANGMYKVLSTNTQGSNFDQLIDATHYFNDSLNYQWMTTEALVSTLKNYANAETEIGKKAFAAAQDIKTFTMMMDTLKEAAQSGWAQTWEIIVGDLEKAKKLWTTVGNAVGGVIESMSNSRNNLLKGALENSGWDKLTNAITEAGISTNDFEKAVKKTIEEDSDLQEQFKKDEVTLDKLIEKHGSLEKVFRDGAISSDILKKALKNINSELVDLSNIEKELRRGSNGDDVKKIQKALKEAGYQCGEFGDELDGVDGKLGPVTEKMIKAFQEANGLKVDGIIGPETLEALEKANKKTNKLKKNIDKLVDGISELGGRELLIESLANIFNFLKDILENVRKAWDKVFEGFKSSDLYNIIKRFHEFTETLSINEETASKIQNAFEGVFTVLKIVKDVIFGVVGVGVKLVWNVFKPLVDVALSAASAFGELVKKGGKTISKVFEPLSGLLSSLSGFLGDVAAFIGETVSDWIDKFSELEIVKTISGYFQEGVETITGALGNIKPYLDNFDFDTITEKLGMLGKAFKWVGDRIEEFAKSDLFTSIKPFFQSIDFESIFSFDGLTKLGKKALQAILAPFYAINKFFSNFGFKLPTFDELFTGFVKFFNFLNDGNYTGIFGTITGIFEYIKSKLSYKITSIKNSLLVTIPDFFVKHGAAIKEGFKITGEIFDSIVEFLFGAEKVDLPRILKVVKEFLMIGLLWKSMNAIETVASPFADIANGFKQLTKSVKWGNIADAFKSMTVALIAFTACLYVLDKMPLENAWSSVGMLLALLGVMAGIVAGLTFVAGKFGGEVKLLASFGSILALATSLALIVGVLKVLDGTEFKNIDQSLDILISVLMSLATSVGIIGLMCKDRGIKAAAAILTLLAAVKMIPSILQMYAEFPWDTVKSGLDEFAMAVLGLLSALALIAFASRKSESLSGAGILLLSMVVSLKLILSAIETAAAMSEAGTLEKGLWPVIGLLSVITVLMGALIAVSNLTSKGTVLKKGEKAVNSFSGFVAALLGVVAAIWLLGKMNIDTLKQGGLAVAAILGMFTVMFSLIGLASKQNGFKGALPMLIGMAVIVAEIGVIMYLLKDLDGPNAAAQFGAMALILISMTACLNILTKHTNKAKNIYKWVGAMAVFALVVGELAVIMKLVQGVDGVNAIAQFGAISIILFTMAEVLEKLTSHYGMKPENIYKWVLAMGAFGLVVGELALIMKLIQGVDGVNAIGQFTALSIILATMSGCLRILSTQKSVDPASLWNLVAAMAALGAICLILGQVLVNINGIDPAGSLPNALALSVLLLAMSGAVYILSTMQMTITQAASSAIGMIGMAAALWIASQALVPLATLPWQGLLAAALALVGVVTLVTLVSTMATLSGSGSLLLMAAAIIAISYALQMLSSIGLDKIIGSVLGLAAALVVLGVATAVFGAAAGIMVIGIGVMALMAVTVGLLGAALLITGVGMTTMSVGLKDLGEAFIVFAQNVVTAINTVVVYLANSYELFYLAGYNVVAGFGLGMIDGAGAAIEAIMNVGSSVLNSICEFFGIHSPSILMQTIGSYIGDGLALGLTSSSGTVSESAGGLATTIKEKLDLSNVTSQEGTETGSSFVSALSASGNMSNVDLGTLDFASITSQFNNAGKAGGTSFTSSLGQYADLSSLDFGSLNVDSLTSKFSSAGTEAGSSFTTGVNNASGDVTMEPALSSMLTEVSDKMPEFTQAGKDLVEGFASGVLSAKSTATTNMNSIANGMLTTARGRYWSFYYAGGYVVDGFAYGISAKTWAAEAKAAAMASAALAAAKEALREKSPSKAFYEVGAYAGEGFINAFADYDSQSSKAGTNLAKSAMVGLKDAITKAKDIVENGVDSQPVIRPILDLTDIESNANRIGSLFGGTKSVGVTANVGAINSMMNTRGQNGVNDDVISAIKDLKNTLGRPSGDTYQFGNITYDEGTEVADAVKSLARAMKVGRRR